MPGYLKPLLDQNLFDPYVHQYSDIELSDLNCLVLHFASDLPIYPLLWLQAAVSPELLLNAENYHVYLVNPYI